MTACMATPCDRPKAPGRGNRFCTAHKTERAERRLERRLADLEQWSTENPERRTEARIEYVEANRERDRQRARDWYAANTERANTAARARRVAQGPQPRVQRYDLTVEEYFALLEAQDGCCAICRTDDTGKRHFFDVDHDHETGVVRGLLCNRCNRLLSNACDDPARLAAAITYLEAVR